MRPPARSIVVVVTAALLALPACSRDQAAAPSPTPLGTPSPSPSPTVTASPSPSTTESGSIVVGLREGPRVLNPYLQEADSPATSLLMKAVLPSMVVVDDDLTFNGQLESELPKVESQQPFTVTWRIKARARWDDGEPITADDVKATFDYIMDPDSPVLNRSGYDLMTEFRIVDPQTFTVTFREPYAAYRVLWSVTTPVLQKKALDAERALGKLPQDFFREELPFSGGPFVVESFSASSGELVLDRNDRYWGEDAPSLDRIRLQPVRDAQALAQALETGAIQAAYLPRASLDLLHTAEKLDFLDYQLTPRLGYEWLDFNLADPALADPAVRHGMAYLIDRERIVETVVKPIARGEVAPLGNVFYTPDQEEYTDDFDSYEFDQVKGGRVLDEAGWTRGPDGIRAKGDIRLSFRLGTTPGDRSRELVQQLIQQQLKDAGIEVIRDNHDDVLGEKSLMVGDYDVLLYGGSGSGDPGGINDVFRGDRCPAAIDNCTADQGRNFRNYQNPELTDILKRTDTETDPARRAELFAQANRILARDLPVLPLFQPSDMIVYDKRLKGVDGTPSPDGPLWNVEEWSWSP